MGRRGEKLLERMRANSRGWRIEEVKALCELLDLDFDRPPRGSHWGVSDASQAHHVTVPFARPIKPV
jgi:hypothetical protein